MYLTFNLVSPQSPSRCYAVAVMNEPRKLGKSQKLTMSHDPSKGMMEIKGVRTTTEYTMGYEVAFCYGLSQVATAEILVRIQPFPSFINTFLFYVFYSKKSEKAEKLHTNSKTRSSKVSTFF
jgi:hypothetical protein